MDPSGEESLFLRILKGFVFIDLNRLYECEDILKYLKIQLEKSFEVDQIVYTQFYRLSAYYYEKKENYDEFYSNSLQYLAYVNQTVILYYLIDLEYFR